MRHWARWDEEHQLVRGAIVGELAPAEAVEFWELLMSQLEGRDRRAILLDHTQTHGVVSRETRKALEEVARRMDYERLALHGVTHFNRIIGRIVLTLVGRTDQTQFFETEDEAIAWLNEAPAQPQPPPT